MIYIGQETSRLLIRVSRLDLAKIGGSVAAKSIFFFVFDFPPNRDIIERYKPNAYEVSGCWESNEPQESILI